MGKCAPNIQENRMDSQSKEGAAKRITLLHAGFTADEGSGAAVKETEQTVSRIV
jgi:hypothetical protein